MAAPKGNKFAQKLSTNELKKEAYKQYCAHIASGLPKEAFVFEHPEISITWETMDVHIKNNPEDFPPHLMHTAMTKRYKHWFLEGTKLMRGEYKNGSPVVWQTIMRNIFRSIGWDKETVTEAHKTHVTKLAQSIRSDVALTQAEASDCDEQCAG